MMCALQTGFADREDTITMKQSLSRRQFVSSAVSVTALSCLPGAERLLARSADATATLGLDQNSAALTSNPAWRDQGVLNLAKSPYAKLHSVPVHAVTIESGFWSPRRETNVSASIPSMGKLLEVNGRMDNFRRLAGKSTAAQRGPVYSDSDIYKWIEAAGFALQSGKYLPYNNLVSGLSHANLLAVAWQEATMTTERLFLALMITAGSMNLTGCRGEAATSTQTPRPQPSANAAGSGGNTNQASLASRHTRPLHRDTPHDAFLSTYNNPEEGISIRYPRNYFLEEGDVQSTPFS
jgi:hypothetical protein